MSALILPPAHYGLPVERRPELVPAHVRAVPPCPPGGLAIWDAARPQWPDDLAHDFTKWMIATERISGDLWAEYLRIYRDDHPAGCRFLLSLYTGLDQAELAVLVATWWRDHADRHWIGEAIESVHHLAALGYEQWIVTGSPTDTMLPLLQLLPFVKVVGMDFEVDDDGRITGRLDGISCAGQGKADKVRSLAGDRPIAVAGGNGSLDAAMMELADQPWSIYPNGSFEEYSRERGWPVLRRPADFVEEAKLA